MQALLSALESVSVETVATTDVVVVPETAGVSDALSIMRTHNIISVPVVGTDRSLRMLDQADIVAHALKAADDDAFFNAPVGDVVRAAGDELFSFALIKGSASLAQAAQIMADRMRVVVTDKDGSPGVVTGVVCRMDLIKFLATRAKNLDTPTVSELGLGQHEALVVNFGETSLRSAFELLVAKQVSSVGLVEAGHLLSVISLSDIRSLDSVAELDTMSVGDFISRTRQRSLFDGSPAIVCSPLDSVSKLLAKFVATGLHRFYMTAEGTRVITLGDVLRAVLAAGR